MGPGILLNRPYRPPVSRLTTLWGQAGRSAVECRKGLIQSSQSFVFDEFSLCSYCCPHSTKSKEAKYKVKMTQYNEEGEQ